MTLKKQCEKIAIELKDIKLKYTGKPEPAVLSFFEKSGYIGSCIEGIMILTVLKALMLDKLVKFNTFNNRDDACSRYLEAQLTILKEKAQEIINSIRNISRNNFKKNFEEIISQPFIKSEYPGLKLKVATALYDAIDKNTFMKLTEKICEDPYVYRNGWPDLIIVKDNDVKFIEVKTTDKLHASQLHTIPIMKKILPFPFVVVRVKNENT